MVQTQMNKEEKIVFNENQKELNSLLASCPHVQGQLEKFMNGHEIKNQNVIGLTEYLMKDKDGTYSVDPTKMNEFKSKILEEETRLDKIAENVTQKAGFLNKPTEFQIEEDKKRLGEIKEEVGRLTELYRNLVPKKTEVEGLAEARENLGKAIVEGESEREQNLETESGITTLEPVRIKGNPKFAEIKLSEDLEQFFKENERYADLRGDVIDRLDKFGEYTGLSRNEETGEYFISDQKAFENRLDREIRV